MLFSKSLKILMNYCHLVVVFIIQQNQTLGCAYFEIRLMTCWKFVHCAQKMKKSLKENIFSTVVVVGILGNDLGWNRG